MINPTPVRQKLRIFTTPKIEDFIRVETVDVSRTSIPEYGTAHPDTENYAGFQLVYVKQHEKDDQGLLFNFYYIAELASQDEYNFEFVDADIGGTKFSAVRRTYVTLRDSFSSTYPSMGTLMSDSSRFDGEFLLAERQQSRIGEDVLDSLFVKDVQTYVRRCSISDIETDKMLGIGVRTTTTLHYRGEIVDGVPIEDLFLDQLDDYWGARADGKEVNGKQLSENWFAVIATSSRDDALEAYVLSFPSSVDLDLPSELLSVSAVWNVAGQNGSVASQAAGRSAYVGDADVSLAISESASAECGGSIQPEIIPVIRSRKGRDIPATAWFFYIKSDANTLSAADVLAKLTTLAGATVNQWPLFNPVQHTFTLKGQRGSGRAQAGASGSVATQDSRVKDPDTNVVEDQERNNKEVSSTKGVSYDLSTSWGTVVLPPTIHPIRTVADATPPASTFTAECSVGWTSSFTAATVAGNSIALPVPANDGTAGILDPTSGDEGTVSDTATVTLSASISPTSLAATMPSAIPTSGLYMVGSPRIEPYEAGWFRVNAFVVNATVFVTT